MPERRILYLSQSDVASLGVTMKEIIDALEIAFREHGNARALERGVGTWLNL